MTKVEAKQATCTEDGNVEYWFCEECDQYFSDENGTSLITEEQTIIKATGHKFENGTCSVCGDADLSISPESPPLPKIHPAPQIHPIQRTPQPRGLLQSGRFIEPADSSDPEDSSIRKHRQKPATTAPFGCTACCSLLCGGGLAAVIIMKKRPKG
ncbi:MAG: hypothetical protein ACLR23_25960 [Clostridia bacterium]